MKLHLGCGKRTLPGYVGVDINPAVNPSIESDVAHLPTIETDSVSSIYACHVLEHLSNQGATTALAEWGRVMQRGGVLRVAVPDFRQMAALYLHEGVTLWRIIGPLMGGQTSEHDFHNVVFDYEYLAWMMGRCFHSIDIWFPDDFLPDGFDDCSRAVIDGNPISLNIMGVAK